MDVRVHQPQPGATVLPIAAWPDVRVARRAVGVASMQTMDYLRPDSLEPR
jgi:hypothetical protein